MTKQELKECITEVKYSDLPKPAKKKIMNVLYDELHKKDWIPCSERLPDEPFECLVTIIDANPMILEDFENILPYHVGYDGKQWNNSDGEQIPFDVIAWQPLPEPYMRGGDLL